MPNKLIIITSFICYLISPIHAAFVVNENCINAYNKIISLRIEEGKSILEKEKAINPSNEIPYYLDNYIDFITLFVSEDKNAFEKLKANKDIRLKRMEKGNSNSPFFLYTQADINLQWAILRIKFKEYFTAGLEIKKAYKLLVENNKRYPLFKANFKGLGMLHAISGAIPENYKWIAKLVGVKGTIKQGVSELKDLLQYLNASDYSYLHDEVFLILLMVEWNLQKDEEEVSKMILKPDFNFNNNPFLVFAKAKIELKTSQNDEAINVLTNRNIDKAYYPFPYLNFMVGIARLNKLDVDAASDFNKYIHEFQGVNYIKTAWQKLAWIALIKSDTVSYKVLIRHCLDEGDDAVDEDKDAYKEAKNRELPNVRLLRARLLCDGGYYQKSIEEIAGMTTRDFTKFKDQLEVTYRIARIHHLKKEYANALQYYQLTMNNGGNSTYYFAANAALQMALIYEKNEQTELAIQYYKACLKMRNHDYQNSIDQKAEAGLNRLGAK